MVRRKGEAKGVWLGGRGERRGCGWKGGGGMVRRKEEAREVWLGGRGREGGVVRRGERHG